MTEVVLGSTEIKVNKNGFGALPIQRISHEDAGELLKMAYNAGINFFDTARFYTDSETKIGEALGDVRENIYIATKTAAQNSDDFWKDLNTSLNNLKTDYIDIYQVHNPSMEQLDQMVVQQVAKRDALLTSIQQSEKRLVEIGTLKKHIINYSKTRSTYEEYRKAGYSKKFLEAHREEITLHKAAKAAFDELGVKKLPKVKELSIEYAEVLTAKKQAYAEYRQVKNEAQELLIAQRNIAFLYDAERKEEEQKRQKENQIH